ESAAAAALPMYGQEPWEVPPREFNDIQRRGFHDGIEGARKDYGNHRRPDVDNREEYRNSDLPPALREPYRAAFRRGYQMAASHLWGAPPPPPPPPVALPPSHDWDERGSRGLEGDAERQGYREGSEAAHRDFQEQRRPDPDDHETYRNPQVPPGLADEYREGFMRGYEVAISQLSGQPVWQIHGDRASGRPRRSLPRCSARGSMMALRARKRTSAITAIPTCSIVMSTASPGSRGNSGASTRKVSCVAMS
ncbi:MAG TPA: hypothetical protein VGG62_04755, partial [Terracidiphilus sp.]